MASATYLWDEASIKALYREQAMEIPCSYLQGAVEAMGVTCRKAGDRNIRRKADVCGGNLGVGNAVDGNTCFG